MTTTQTVELTPEQSQVADAACEAIQSGSDEVTIGGYAGTGKTVLARALKERTGACVVAPTGKAAQVLRNKGIVAETIHSVIYRFLGVKQQKDAEGKPVEKEKPMFDAKDELDQAPPLFIVDESSMVNGEVYSDLRSHGVPIIWIGDHGQLPPVGSDPGIMRTPDHVLKTIHRQAAENPIIQLAHAVRLGESLERFRNLGDERLGIYGPSSVDRIVHFARTRNVDQILCAFNQTRNAVNAKYREALGYRDTLNVGDRVVCLKNNRRKMIFNGMVFTVERIVGGLGSGVVQADIVDDLGNRRQAVSMFEKVFGGGLYAVEEVPKDAEQFDYAYALTVHKSQGSEWPSVLVIDQTCNKWDMKRWRYTAYTRAKEKLTVVKG